MIALNDQSPRTQQLTKTGNKKTQWTKWSKHEKKQLLELEAQGVSKPEIARRLGKTLQSVYSMRKRIQDKEGGVTKICRPWSPQDDAILLESRANKIPYEHICERLGRSVTAAKMRLNYIRSKQRGRSTSLLARHLHLNRDEKADQAWEDAISFRSRARMKLERGKNVPASITSLAASIQTLRLLTRAERIGYLQAVVDFIDNEC